MEITERTPDGRQLIAVNFIPPGYTVYPCGAGDNIANNTYGNGPDLILTAAEPTKNFQLLHHWYAKGGRAIWESATLLDKVNAWLIAPACSGFTLATGDFNKVAIPNTGGTMNLYVPASPGTGAYSGNLSDKIGATTVLKATPVPVTGNTGYFDYNSDTNVLTVSTPGAGGYNLYDFDANLFKFANQIPGLKNGGESSLETPDVIGKLLYNSWKIKFTLTPVTTDVTCGIIITTAAKKNI